MNTTFNIIQDDILLKQSEVYGQEYQNFDDENLVTFNDLSITNIENYYNFLLEKYQFLNDLQVFGIQSLFQEMGYVLTMIDPLKLNLKDDTIDYEDLTIWNKSRLGISKLTFDKFGQVIFQFVGVNGTKIMEVHEGEIDMQDLLFKLLS